MIRNNPDLASGGQNAMLFFAFDPAIREIIYTTNAIENLNRVIRKTTKRAAVFPPMRPPEINSLFFIHNGSTNDPF